MLRMTGALKSVGATFAGLLAIGTVGCGGGNPPTIDETQTYVSCAFDDEYQTYVWDFVTLVDDPDGFEDVSSVYVDVYDTGVSTTDKVETWDLVYDGNGQWSQRVYEYTGAGDVSDYSQALDCENLAAYEFDFYAKDAGGEENGFTYLP